MYWEVKCGVVDDIKIVLDVISAEKDGVMRWEMNCL